MPLFALDKSLQFPPVEFAESDGLLAIGGDLTVDRLLLAYRNGIFPWYEGDHILWWCPHPRFVLFPQNLKVSKSMQQLIKKTAFRFTVNAAFSEVIRNCKQSKRKEQDGTWITDEVEQAYTQLHRLGFAFSAEVWQDDELVGGLYGIKIGRVFFGESMFSKVSNASKFAFISYVRKLQEEGIELIDCQVYTSHLESLGAAMIPREKFMGLLQKLL